MVTERDLLEEAAKFLAENYDLTLSVPIIINPMLIYAEGAFEHTIYGRAVAIHIAEFMFDFAEDDVIYEALRHELVHYAMFMRGNQFIDGEPEFEAELRRMNAISTGAHKVGLYHVYECDACGKEIESPEYLNRQNPYVTHCCDADFKYTGTQRVYNGRERIY